MLGQRKSAVAVLVAVLCLIVGMGDNADAHKGTKKTASEVRVGAISDSEINGSVSSKRDACKVGRQVDVAINGTDAGSATTDDEGSWTLDVSVEDGDVVRASISKVTVGKKGKRVVCKADEDTKTADIEEPTQHEVIVDVTGAGEVDSTPAGINNCRESSGICIADFTRGSQVTLTATPDAGQQLQSWGGDCAGTQATCTLTMNEDKEVFATFVSSNGGEGDTCPIPTDVIDPVRGVLCTVVDLLSGQF